MPESHEKHRHLADGRRYDAGMRYSLTHHPDSRCMAVSGVDVAVARQGGGELVLRYVVTGNIADLLVPPGTSATRTDGLWRHTCFEAFVRTSNRAAYYEFNFSPSTQWAAYRFGEYRTGTRVANEIGAPHIEVQSNGGSFELTAFLNMEGLPDLPVDSAWRLGLSAVIEELDGTLSYWALAHPPGKPDFHHSDCFALQLPAA